MPRFRVGVPEVHYSYRTVTADSVEEALDEAMQAEEIEELEYSHTLEDGEYLIQNMDTECEAFIFGR